MTNTMTNGKDWAEVARAVLAKMPPCGSVCSEQESCHCIAALMTEFARIDRAAEAGGIERAAARLAGIGDTILHVYERPGGPPGNARVPFTGTIAANLIRSLPAAQKDSPHA